MPAASSIGLIDAHHHLWDAERYSYPWLSARGSTVVRHYEVADLLADAANRSLVKSVHVQGEIARDQSLAETAWLQAGADLHGFPQAIVAYAPLHDAGVHAILEQQAAYANVRGIRQILNPDQTERPDYLTDPAWRAGYALLARFRLSFDLQVDPAQMVDAADVARVYPEVPMIVNHTGMPRDQSPEGLELWRTGMRRLAEQPHLSAKISGFAMFDPAWTTDSIRSLVLETIDIFGVERCMFGSNFPVDKLFKTYDQIFEAFETLTADLSPTERHKLFQANAERIYRI